MKTSEGTMTNRYYAHTLEGKDEKNWHKLEDHLYAVAELAGDFAAEFGTGKEQYWSTRS